VENAKSLLSVILMVTLLSCSGEDKKSTIINHNTIILVKNEYESSNLTVANTTELYIDLKSGGERELILRADNIGNMRLIWLSENRLLVSYKDGTITQFRNSWETNDPDIPPVMIDLLRIK
jgi:hypothetical protein